jgi:hypothetical protein
MSKGDGLFGSSFVSGATSTETQVSCTKAGFEPATIKLDKRGSIAAKLRVVMRRTDAQE